MSTATRDKPQQVTLCDLCGVEMTEASHYERASVVSAYHPKPEAPERVKWWALLWNPRNWPGRWGSHHDLRDPYWTYRRYDMHTECLVRMIEHSIALREDIP